MNNLVTQGLAVYPRPPHRDGAALFRERYAEAFFTKWPEWVGKSYHVLKEEFPNDPIIRGCVDEFINELHDTKLAVKEWEKQWPDAAAHLDRERMDESRRRYKRHAENLRDCGVHNGQLEVGRLEDALVRLQSLRQVGDAPDKVKMMQEKIMFEKRRVQRMQERLLEMETRVQSWV